MNKILTKKWAIILVNLLLLIIGIAMGSIGGTVSKETKMTDISDDKTYDNLVDTKYTIYSKQIISLEKGFQGDFILTINNQLSENQLFELGQAIYEHTISKQRNLQKINIKVYFNSVGSNVNKFYNENLLYVIDYDKPINRITISEYIVSSDTEEDVNRTPWVINNIEKDMDTIKVDVAMQDDVCDRDVLAQVRGLTEQIKELNSTIDKDDGIFFTVTNSSNNALLYNSKFNNVYAKAKYRNII